MRSVIAGVFLSFLTVLPAGATDEPSEDKSPVTDNSAEVSAFEIPEDAEFLEDRIVSGKEAEVHQQEIPFQTREIDDPVVPEGREIIVEEGVAGIEEHIALIDSSAGYSKTVQAPQTEVVRVGTGENYSSAPAIEPVLFQVWEEERIAEAEAALLEEQREEERRERQEEREQRLATDDMSSRDSDDTNEDSGYIDSPTGGGCLGWGHLIHDYFGDSEYDKACSVMKCESTGDTQAQNPVSTASGLFQFLDTTWDSTKHNVGAGEYPRAKNAPAELQVAAAADLRDRYGWSQWVCQ